MSLGEKAQLVISSELAYGATGRGMIPPNADVSSCLRLSIPLFIEPHCLAVVYTRRHSYVHVHGYALLTAQAILVTRFLEVKIVAVCFCAPKIHAASCVLQSLSSKTISWRPSVNYVVNMRELHIT
jgi:hypothetical protein